MTSFGRQSGSKSLTLEQIGKRAGVSRSTVSRVLNDHADVRPEVRARVEAVIAETGYQPNQAARALVSKRTGLIGLVMLADVDELFGDPYYSALVTGIQQGCGEHGLVFAIFPVHGSDDGPEALASQIAQGFVDGVIVTAGPRSEPLVSALRDQRRRMVVVGHPASDEGLLRVDVENRAGSAAAVAHLVEHGYERIGFVGPEREHRFGTERLDGYRDALTAAGSTIDERLVHREESSVAGGYRATRRLLAAKPDAVFVSTDPMAEGAYQAIREEGLEIPSDIAIVGFDGLPGGPNLEPELTTVVQPVLDVGRAAVALLASETQAPDTQMLPTALRLAASCGAPDRHQ